MEELAPAAQRNPVKGHREALVEHDTWTEPANANRRVSGYRRVDTLLTLFKRGEFFQKQHLIIADRYRKDFELSIGAKPGFEKVQAGTGFNSTTPSQVQLNASRRIRLAQSAIGPSLLPIVHEIVILNHTVTAWAEKRHMNTQMALGRLIAGLDRLGDYYAYEKRH